jgi:hypothetical protein
VAAYLDYEMDQMSGFVAETAQGMYDLYKSKICLADIDVLRSVQPGSSVSPAFRKFVLQILSSTRLPSSTIFLALHYLLTRMTMLSNHGQHKSSSGQVYRMLTISLLLGSKFLDDNTFQNRSWSEVSGLAVSELNKLEMEWLVAIDWKLHVDIPDDPSYQAIDDRFKAWQKASARAAISKLPPIDTSIQRRHSRPQEISPPSSGYPSRYPKQLASGGTAESHPSQYPQPARYEQGNWPYSRSRLDYSPPSAPETGPPTPDYRGYGGQWSFNLPPPPPPYPLHHTAHGPVQVPPYPQQPYSQCIPPTIWTSHTAGCACPYCNRAHEPYFMAPAYGPQPVAG